MLSSVVTLGFCLLFGIKSARLHNFVVAIVAAIISASLVLILSLDYAF